MSASLSPLYLNQFTREVWSEHDALVMAQLEPALREGCYDIKVYKSPDITQEVLADQGYIAHGLSITPGSLLVGYIFPADFDFTEVAIQITDVSLDHKFFSGPIPWYMLSNGRLDMPNLLPVPHPVVGSGRFMVELWNVSGGSMRVQIMFLVLEPKK